MVAVATPRSPPRGTKEVKVVNDNYSVHNVSNAVRVAHIAKGKLNLIKEPNHVSFVFPSKLAGPAPDVPPVVQSPPVGARLQKFWARLGVSLRTVQILKEGYVLPFQDRPKLSREPVVESGYVNAPRQAHLVDALHALVDKEAVEKVKNPNSLAFYNRLFLVPKPNNKWRPILDLSSLNKFIKVSTFKMETPESIRLSLQQGEWVTSVDFRDAYFHIPIHPQSRKFLRFYLKSTTYQFQALPFGLCTAPMEFTMIAKEVKLIAQSRGIRLHQYLDDWLVRAHTYQECLTHTRDLVALCQELGWLVNLDKSELVPKQIFNFVGYQYDLEAGRVRPTQDRWEALQDKIQGLLSVSQCRVRQFMSLIGLLTATEKLVWLGRLHMRPIQWHLKMHWRIPESLEKLIPVPTSLHPHLRWWLDRDRLTLGQPLHPVAHTRQIFTDASHQGWGAHMDDQTAQGDWSKPERDLHINILELKAVFLALQEFRELCTGHTVLVATDNTTVVAYINKQGGMRSGPLCALLWRTLTWCTKHQISLRARHIPGRLNVIADKLSRLGQTIPTQWSLSPQVFQAICQKWHWPQVDLFATRFNNKLSQFVSPVPDHKAWAVDALTLDWQNLDPYAFPPSALLDKVVRKLLDHPVQRIILIAPGWPNQTWFWDLIDMSVQIPLCLPLLPDLLTQPFNRTTHHNLEGLNLHAWLLGPQQAEHGGSLRQWQNELRLRRDPQLAKTTSQNGIFSQRGVKRTRWTSGRPL